MRYDYLPNHFASVLHRYADRKLEDSLCQFPMVVRNLGTWGLDRATPADECDSRGSPAALALGNGDCSNSSAIRIAPNLDPSGRLICR